MDLDRTPAIAERVIRQIVNDRRTLALIFVAPIIVMSLAGFGLSAHRAVLNHIAPALLAVFVLFFTFLLAGVSFLRERGQGTLERLLTTPVGRADLMVGYMLGFLIFAAIQAMLVLLYTILVLQVGFRGNLVEASLFLLILAVVGVSLGILISTFAHNEFQIVQFIPIIIIPQIFLSGVIVPIREMPTPLEILSQALPLTYAVDGIQKIMLKGDELGDVAADIAALVGFAVILIALATITLRRSE